MKSELLIDRGKLAVVELTNGDHRLRLALRLADEYTSGDLSQFARQATASIEGLDAISSSYNWVNWLSGVADGAFYAFRTLDIPRQKVVVTDFSGRLEASDMEAIASAAAMAVATLANKELPNMLTPGWTCEAHVTKRSPTELDDSDDVAQRAH